VTNWPIASREMLAIEATEFREPKQTSDADFWTERDTIITLIDS